MDRMPITLIPLTPKQVYKDQLSLKNKYETKDDERKDNESNKSGKRSWKKKRVQKKEMVLKEVKKKSDERKVKKNVSFYANKVRKKFAFEPRNDSTLMPFEERKSYGNLETSST